MDFLTSTVLSGLLWDGIKNGISITADFLRRKLKDWILSDVNYEKLAEAMSQIPPASKYSFDSFYKYIDDSSDIQKILSTSIPVSAFQDNRYSTGTIVGHANNVVNIYSTDGADNLKKN